MSTAEEGVVHCDGCGREIRTVITLHVTTRHGGYQQAREDMGRRCARKHAAVWRDMGSLVTTTRWRVG